LKRGYVTAQADGAKKLYAITDEGRAHLQQNRDFVDAVLERFATIGERVRARRADDEVGRGGGDSSMPRSIQGAFQDLSQVVRELLHDDRSAKAKIIEAIDRATEELRRK